MNLLGAIREFFEGQRYTVWILPKDCNAWIATEYQGAEDASAAVKEARGEGIPAYYERKPNENIPR